MDDYFNLFNNNVKINNFASVYYSPVSGSQECFNLVTAAYNNKKIICENTLSDKMLNKFFPKESNKSIKNICKNFIGSLEAYYSQHQTIENWISPYTGGFLGAIGGSTTEDLVETINEARRLTSILSLKELGEATKTKKEKKFINEIKEEINKIKPLPTDCFGYHYELGLKTVDIDMKINDYFINFSKISKDKNIINSNKLLDFVLISNGLSNENKSTMHFVMETSHKAELDDNARKIILQASSNRVKPEILGNTKEMADYVVSKFAA
jgi:hypothetical protein